MRVGLSPSMILKLAVAVPTTSPDKDPLIAVPMVLRMGWMESPPTFCMVTETIADLANTKIAQGYIPASYHRHKAVANTTPQTPTMTEWNVCRTLQTHTWILERPRTHLSLRHLRRTLQVPRTPQTKALEWEMPAQHPQLHYDSRLRK